MHWQTSVGIFCLNIVNVADYKSPLNVDLTVPPVEITPLLPNEFACAESEASSNNAHSADGFLQMIQKKSELI